MYDDYIDDCDDDFWDGMDWNELALLFGMSEDVAREKREKERIEKDMFGDEYLDIVDERY